MKLLDIKGRSKYKNCNKYRVKWEAKSRSKYQKAVKDFLYKYWENHAVYEEFPVFGSRMSLDFYNLTKAIAIEVQGEGHTQYSEFFHGNPSGYQRQFSRDRAKENFCEINGIEYVEIFPEDIPKLSPSFFKKLGVSI